MKKYICLCIVLFFAASLFSQNDTIQGDDYESKIGIINQDDKEYMEARDPIIRIIHDTLGCDHIEQHFYHNGNLFCQIPFINGRRNGIYVEYHPNGQLKYKQEMKEGHYIQTCKMVSFDRFGDISVSRSCFIYKGENYYAEVDYFLGEPSHLMIYSEKPMPLHGQFSCLVGEFMFDADKKKWEKRAYHTKSIKSAKKLLKAYLKDNQ